MRLVKIPIWPFSKCAGLPANHDPRYMQESSKKWQKRPRPQTRRTTCKSYGSVNIGRSRGNEGRPRHPGARVASYHGTGYREGRTRTMPA